MEVFSSGPFSFFKKEYSLSNFMGWDRGGSGHMIGLVRKGVMFPKYYIESFVQFSQASALLGVHTFGTSLVQFF